ncbi:glycosyltransferase [Brevundimonas mediterranea]|uniref:UDP:flavonoid glycosyltransferase YjiC (YdhE family) n=1 Tax=Brevundimonas mediterranea TaxID=74329 RepID=A0A7W6A7Y1_9CAUL|nr:glycosyltransferase [Brevundimonas mediterranea]MBB3873410.1 UDP:flavonoid glycosyltransferase YjiC (YdhE family) [Brevundimonas mediterranea]
MPDAGRIVLATGGSLGDLHPFIALGRALQSLGHKVGIATAVDYRDKIEAAGLTFHQVGPSIADLTRDTGMDLSALTAAIAKSDRFLFGDILLPRAEDAARQLIAVTEGAAAVVGSTLAIGAQFAAEHWRIPCVAVSLQPTMVFSRYDPPFLPAAPWLKPATSGPQLWLNDLTRALGRMSTARWTAPMNAIRASLGLPQTKDNIVFDAGRSADLYLGLYSPLLSPRQADAAPNFAVVGYAAYDSETGGPSALAPDLEAFLKGGPPPLVFTLGSAAVNIPGDFYVESLKAARRLAHRAVLLVGPDGDQTLAKADAKIHVAAYAPFSLLFPRAAAIVHQGGIGTVHQALSSGRPQLVVPHLGDQYDNAARVVRLGCGRSLARPRYRSDTVAAALRALAEDPLVSARAEAVAPQVRAQDGAAAAAARISALLRPS